MFYFIAIIFSIVYIILIHEVWTYNTLKDRIIDILFITIIYLLIITPILSFLH
jgi:uncharacterized membrane protein YagU involved in acid resistance